jgi:hypothetical protein
VPGTRIDLVANTATTLIATSLIGAFNQPPA